MACADCKLWCSSAGAPICGICRASRALRALPTDSRLTSSNYDLVQSILDRALGEVNGWLAVPLAESAVEASPKSDSPELGDRTGSDERPSRRRSLQKEKRSDRDSERREEPRELRRIPPTPPPPPRKEHSPEHSEISLTAASKRKAAPSQDLVSPWGKSHKANKGKKHRERGIRYRENFYNPDTNGPEAKARSSQGSGSQSQIKVSEGRSKPGARERKSTSQSEEESR